MDALSFQVGGKWVTSSGLVDEAAQDDAVDVLFGRRHVAWRIDRTGLGIAALVWLSSTASPVATFATMSCSKRTGEPSGNTALHGMPIPSLSARLRRPARASRCLPNHRPPPSAGARSSLWVA